MKALAILTLEKVTQAMQALAMTHKITKKKIQMDQDLMTMLTLVKGAARISRAIIQAEESDVAP